MHIRPVLTRSPPVYSNVANCCVAHVNLRYKNSSVIRHQSIQDIRYKIQDYARVKMMISLTCYWDSFDGYEPICMVADLCHVV